MGELSVRELPLFPLPEVVLFPQEVLPLHIFESRYRMMLQSVLESDSMFGVIKWDPNSKTMGNVGCCAQVIKHQTADDGRSNIITLGQQRFQVLEIIRSTPFCSAMVSWISDENIDDLQKLDSLKDSVTEALSDVIKLTSKLTNTKKSFNINLILRKIPFPRRYFEKMYLYVSVSYEIQGNLRQMLLIE